MYGSGYLGETMSFFRRWLDGVKNLSVLEQLRGQRAGFIGSLVGLVAAFGLFAWRGQWVWLPILGFSGLVLLMQLVGVQQQIAALERIEQERFKWKGLLENMED